MVILGIDPALTITGYGVIETTKDGFALIEAGIIKTTPKEGLVTRLDKIYSGLLKLIADTKPQVMVLEKIYSHYAHPATAYLLGHARGVISLACAKENIQLVEYAATQVKKAITGRGQASKHQVQKMVCQILDLNSFPKYADVSDALALAITHKYLTNSLK